MQRCQGQADLDRHTVRHGDDTLMVQEHVSIDFWDTQGNVRRQTKGTTTIDHYSTSAHDLGAYVVLVSASAANRTRSIPRKASLVSGRTT